MKKELKTYKIINNIKDNDKKQISIIELNNKKYILKKVKNYDITLVNMLKNEVNILYKLKDTYVVPQIYYYNFSEEDNVIIIELIKGKTINKLNFENNKQKIELMLKILEVVKEIHKMNIIHCDLKPDNILLDLNKNIKIIDFGISINDNKNYFIGYGNTKYCSKEQLNKESIDCTTDIYSLGIIFYELMLGKLPFNGTNNEIKEKKKKNEYEKTNNVLLNLIFSKIFSDNEKKYMTIEELENDLKLFLLG